MPTFEFNYYLHDNAEFWETMESISDQGVPQEFAGEVASAVRNAFYELQISCEYDTATGKLTATVVV